MSFAERYGPWAVVAGASEGLGAAFADELARRGLHLVLLARRAEPLAELAEKLRSQVLVVTVAGDVADPSTLERLVDVTANWPIGLVVANAAYSPVGPFLETEQNDLLQAIDVNCIAP